MIPSVVRDWLAINVPACALAPEPGAFAVVMANGAIESWGASCGTQPTALQFDAFAVSVERAAYVLVQAKAAAIAANQAECRRRILAKWPLEKQSSAALGIYPQATTDELATDIAAHITAENAAADLITAAASVAEVEAITVTWPEA